MSVTERLTTALAGRYRLERHLGEGGMATVYLAEDLKHKRKVALKVLRPELAAILGAERFLKEIELTANLQHPNILPLYDSGEADTFLYYVMPFVEGESLRDRLNRERQLAVDEAIEITKSVAAALQYAHERKVVHRDIKPENILIQSGQALVADFGIALAVSQAGGTRLTQTGLSLGTPAYMSPEQATGDRVLDARSDIYSLGCMTYEMLVGEPPHVGNSVQAIIARILSERPHPVSQTRDLVPPNVDAAVQKALAKSPADRFRSAAEYSSALTNATFAVPAALGGTSTVAPPSRSASRTTLTLAAVSVLAISAAGWGWLRPRPEAAAPVARLSFVLPDSAVLQQQFGTLFALTDDGSSVVYVGPGDNDIDLWMRPLNSLTATRIPGTEGADSPFLSPDGGSVAFYRNSPNALFSVSLRGGPRETLVSDSMVSLGGDFGPDGSIYFVRTGGLRRRVVGGDIEEVTRLDSARGDVSHAWPDVLPGGRAVLFTIERARADQHDIAVVDLKTRQVTILFRGTFARYSPTGHIVFAAVDGGLFAVAFDEKTLATHGSAIPVASGVVVSERGAAHFALSGSGSLLYGTGATGSSQQLERLDRAGRVQVVDSLVRGLIGEMEVSPDGKRLAFSMRDNSGVHIWTKDLDGGPTTRVTSGSGGNFAPSWRPDGRSVSFLTFDSRTSEFRQRRADGSGEIERLPSIDKPTGFAFLSRDSEWAVFQTDLTPGRLRDLYARRVRGDTTIVALAATAAGEVAPRLSPDGKWLAYASTESGVGQMEVYVSPFPNTSASRTQVSIDGGAEPLWSPTGRELFYTATAGLVLTAARVQVTPEFRVLERTPLFSRSSFVRSVPDGPFYGVSPDGQYFYMTRMRGTSREQLVMVLNWFEELKGEGRR